MNLLHHVRRLARLAPAALLTLAAVTAPALAQEPIRIGSFLSVTGPASFLGDPELKTLELYVERINAAGGVNGRKLQLTAYDDAGDAEKARTFAKRLIEQDKVDVIVGGSTTGTTMAAVPLVEQAGVPFVSLAGAVVIVEPVKKWVFKTQHTDRVSFFLGVLSELGNLEGDGRKKNGTPSASMLGFDCATAQKYSTLEYVYTRRVHTDSAPVITASHGLAVDFDEALRLFAYTPPVAPPRKVRPPSNTTFTEGAANDATGDESAWYLALRDAGMLGERRRRGWECVCPLAHEHTEGKHGKTSTLLLNSGALSCLRGANHLRGNMKAARDAMPAHVQHHFHTAGQARAKAMVETTQRAPQLTRDEASAKVLQAILEAEPGVITVVEAPTGAGKTHATLRAAAQLGAMLIAGPTLGQLEDSREDFLRDHKQHASLRRGVLSVLGDDGKPVCKHLQTAERVQAAGGSVPELLCKRCVHASTCPAQQTESPTPVEFLPHQLLEQRVRVRDTAVPKVVVDETPTLLEALTLGKADLGKLQKLLARKGPTFPMQGPWRAAALPFLAILREFAHGDLGLAEATTTALDNDNGDEMLATACNRVVTQYSDATGRVPYPERSERYQTELNEARVAAMPLEFRQARACVAALGRPRLRGIINLADLPKDEVDEHLEALRLLRTLWQCARSWGSLRASDGAVRCHARTSVVEVMQRNGAVLLDGTPNIPLLESVFGTVRVVRIDAADGAKSTREHHYTPDCTRSKWCSRGAPVLWERVTPVLEKMFADAEKNGVTKLLVVTFSPVAKAMTTTEHDAVKRWREAGRVVEFTHYGPAVRGANDWKEFDGFATLGDPYADVGAVSEQADAINADFDNLLMAQCRSDLGQAHGRARDPGRTAAAWHGHYGKIPPHGWTDANAVMITAPRGRPVTVVMTAEEFDRACKAQGWATVRAAAEALGVDASTVSRWATGARAVPQPVAERLLPQLPTKKDLLVGISGNTAPVEAVTTLAVRPEAPRTRYQYRQRPDGTWQAREHEAPRAPWDTSNTPPPWIDVPAPPHDLGASACAG